MKLTVNDLPFIIDAIHNNSDLLRIFFGCKALRKILSVGNEYTIKMVIDQYQFIGKRLVNLLMIPQNQELQIEILWTLVNLTSLKDNKRIRELIEFGMFEAIMNMLEDGNTQIECLEKVELSLIVLCNAIADQDKTKVELLNLE